MRNQFCFCALIERGAQRGRERERDICIRLSRAKQFGFKPGLNEYIVVTYPVRCSQP